MLGKLIKHEFRATARTMVPLFLILLAVTLCAFAAFNFLTAGLGGMFAAMFMFLFFLAVLAMLIMSFVLMIQRFKNNLLSDEGYLMFTLPVSIHSLLWSKLIVSTVWFVAAGAAAVLATMLSTARAVRAADADWRGMGQSFSDTFGLNNVGYVLELVLALLLGCVCLCLLFYAAMSLGHSFAHNKGLWSVLLAIGFFIVAQMLGITSLVAVFRINAVNTLSTAVQIHASLGSMLAAEAVYAAVFYVVTWLSLQRRMNLA
ncbi:MAG TPA: hypothetical protein PLD83_06625 [Oscillospiraceae bacterium]|nr:hypothetical protein [Oscillospiraceae bacterium]